MKIHPNEKEQFTYKIKTKKKEDWDLDSTQKKILLRTKSQSTTCILE